MGRRGGATVKGSRHVCRVMDERRRAAVLGRNSGRARVAAGAVLALAAATYVLGRFVGGQGLVSASVEWLPLLVGAVVLVPGGVAAASAYWNDGLAVSLAAVFGPTVAWLWLFFTSGTGTVLAGTVAEVVGFATVATAVVGPPAYVVGRLARASVDGEAITEREWAVRALVGHDTVVAKRTAALAVALVPVGAGVLLLADVLPGTSARAAGFVFFVVGAVSRGPAVGAAVVALWLVVAAVAAYRGRGLLGSVALVGGPLLGGNGYLFVSTGISGAGPALDAALGLVAAAIFAVALGVPGYLLGGAARRLVEPESLDA